MPQNHPFTISHSLGASTTDSVLWYILAVTERLSPLAKHRVTDQSFRVWCLHRVRAAAGMSMGPLPCLSWQPEVVRYTGWITGVSCGDAWAWTRFLQKCAQSGVGKLACDRPRAQQSTDLRMPFVQCVFLHPTLPVRTGRCFLRPRHILLWLVSDRRCHFLLKLKLLWKRLFQLCRSTTLKSVHAPKCFAL